jgi:uncharacterized protein (TIGR00369 family)
MSAHQTVAELQARLARSPFISFLAPTVTEANPEKGRVVMRMSMKPEFERTADSNQFHGGVIAALIDTVGDYALIAQIGVGIPTINFSTDFLRPAKGPTLEAVAQVRRAGRSIGVVDIDVFDDAGVLVAVGRGCYATQVGNK